MVDINRFHVSLAHVHSSELKATVLQHGIQLVEELIPCSGCSMAKGIRSPTPHHTTSWAAAPMDMVHIDTAGPFQESLGGSRCVVMFVDSASRFPRPYGIRDKSASAILGVGQRFVADMGVPQAFRTDNGAEYPMSTFVDYCNSLRIRRELTAPYTPQQNGPVESGFLQAIKAEHAAQVEVNKLFPGVHLEKFKGVRDPNGSSVWMKSVLWASEGFNHSATTANSGMLSPHEVFFGVPPPMPVLPFSKPAYHRVPRQSKMDRQARPCFFLNFGYNHGSDCFKIMDAATGRIAHSRDVTWHQPREPLISPAPTVRSGVPSHRAVPKRRTTCIFSRYLQLLLCLLPRRCLRQPTPHPRRYNPPRLNSRSRCSGTRVRGRRAYAWSHARRNARDEGISPQHGSDVPCHIGARDGHPRGVRRGLPKA